MPGQALPKEVTWLGALVLQPGLFNIVMFPRTLLCFSNFFHSRVDVLYLMLGSRNPGREEIEKAKESKPDLIVLALAMPVMNGLEAAPVLRPMLPTVPIILFTLYADKFLEREAISAGITVVVSKDAALKTLVNRAQELLRATQA